MTQTRAQSTAKYTTHIITATLVAENFIVFAVLSVPRVKVEQKSSQRFQEPFSRMLSQHKVNRLATGTEKFDSCIVNIGQVSGHHIKVNPILCANFELGPYKRPINHCYNWNEK